jgi:CDP-ribitol ribitolphosphotransferase
VDVGARFLYAIYRWAIRAVFTILRQSPTRSRIAFLSRQGDEPSLDFKLLAAALHTHLPDWEIAESCYRDSGSTLKRIKGTLRQLRLVATARLCIVDGYTPAVSIPRLSEDTVVIQLWHALGAFKRFGWQAVGTSRGRTQAQARGLCMHRNYTAIMAGGDGARLAFAQAFSCPEDKVIALGLPRMDYLLDKRLSGGRRDVSATVVAQHPQLVGGRTNILFAPTFRRDTSRADVERYVWDLASHLPAKTSNLILSFHPLSNHRGEVAARTGSSGDQSADQGGGLPVSQSEAFPSNSPVPIFHIPHTRGIDLLEIADYVITDYSAIAFEAALLRRKVLFYVPDIADYRRSPGLNIDVEELFPLITFEDATSLVEFLQRDIRYESRRNQENPHDIAPSVPVTQDVLHDEGHSHYATSGFWQYCDSYLAQPTTGVTECLAIHLTGMIA